MIKITNEIDDRKYELLTDRSDCDKCAFYNGGCNCTNEQSNFNDYVLCIILNGIWKEVKDEDNK